MATRTNRVSASRAMLTALSCAVVFPASAQGHPPTPPEEAVTACSGIAQSDPCRFVTRHGHEIAGSCQVLMNDVAACVPSEHMRGERPGRERRNGDDS